jgi:endonuclease YncB( thermonuclease family)
MPRQIDAGTTYTVDVLTVTDGDTVDVRFPDGSREEVRVIGVDCPETPGNRRFERTQEWPGIDDGDVLAEWGERARAFARDRLAGAAVTLAFDPSEPVRDEFDRLLAYLEHDADRNPGGGDGEGDGRTLYNRRLLAEGYARAYDSGITNHDALRGAGLEARSAGRGLWAESDPGASEPVRDRAVEQLFVPRASSVRTVDGRLPTGRAPVRAASTASQELRGAGATSYAGERPPLVGLDRERRVGLVGGLLVDEAYEAAEGFPVDTSGFGQFPFLTNLAALLSGDDRDGAVLIDGGHGQFGVDYALSAEDAAYYRRYLEGQGIALEQRNRLSAGYLETGRALLVTTPVGAFGEGELDRVRAFRDDGGAVLLAGSAAAPAFARRNLDRLAAALGSDLRLNADRVRDEHRNLDGDPLLPTTARFDRSLPLFDAFAEDRRPVCLELADVTADPPGGELAAETVTLRNCGGRALAMGGWTLRDLAGRRYAFPEGFELPAGEAVTVHTGEGSDTGTDLFWGAGRPVWNDRGDTVIVADAGGRELLRTSY